MKPRVLLLLPALLALWSCVSELPTIRPAVPDDSTFLGLAVGEASRLTEDLVRAELYGRIAIGYSGIGDEQTMVVLASAALQLARNAGQTDESIRIRLALAPLLASAGGDEQALSAIESGLRYAVAATDSQTRAGILPLVVQSALRSDEPARPFLRRAVDEIYVIEDPEYRAEALIRVAELYQAGGPSLSVTGLIQQAIPAVRSASGGYQRAALFIRLADLAYGSGETRLGDRLVDFVVTEVRGSGAPTDQAQADRLLDVVVILARRGRVDDALFLLEPVREPAVRARGLISLAGAAESESVRLARLQLASRLVDEIDDPESAADVSVRLAVGYHDAGNASTALQHAQRAAALIVADPEIYSGVELPGRLAAVFVMLDRQQLVRELLLSAPDEYVRGVVAVRASDQLIGETRLGLADDFLTIALIASDEATYLADGLRQQIVGGFARTGSLRLAIRTIERISDALIRARSVAELAVTAEPAGLVTAIYRADLASVLAPR